MNIEKQMQKAVGRFDWPAVEARLKAIEPIELRDWAENFLNVILRDGYLILRRPNAGHKEHRDTFIARLRSFLQDGGMQDLINDRADAFSSLTHTETAYQEVLASLQNGLRPRLTLEQFVWASIRAAETGSREMEAQIKSNLPQHLDDPVVAKFRVDSDGVPANPDSLLNALQGTLTATLKMLAYANSWFNHQGILVLPMPVPTSKEHQNIAEANVYLAAAWSQIERSDGRCRYFGGAVTREEIDFQSVKGPHHGEAIRFSFANGREIELHVAGERLRRMFFGFFVDLELDKRLEIKVVAMPPVPPSPHAFVSPWEAHGAIALSHVFFKAVTEITTLFAGLTLLEWLRGYAVVQKLARERLDSPQPAEGIVMIEEEVVTMALIDHGLPEDKARVFFRHVTFGKGSDDVFDAPFVRCQDGRSCFIVGAAAHLNPAFVVLSQLSSLRCDMAWKGKPFEANTLRLFCDHGVDAVRIYRRINGAEVEIDSVALWDDILFVCENKNYFLPSDNPQSEFWFLQDQAAAARQVRTKVRVIETHPEIVSEALGKKVTWKRIVPVVLNGAPFSLPGPIQGVYFYDASALHRFFEEGQISYTSFQGVGEVPRVIPKTVTRLWSGPRASADDLVRQMEQPEQVIRIAREFSRVRRRFPISEQLYVATVIPDRKTPTIESIAGMSGIEEAQLDNNPSSKPRTGNQ
jgi:hypothetical protein